MENPGALYTSEELDTAMKKVCEYVKKYDNVSFAELERRFKDEWGFYKKKETSDRQIPRP